MEQLQYFEVVDVDLLQPLKASCSQYRLVENVFAQEHCSCEKMFNHMFESRRNHWMMMNGDLYGSLVSHVDGYSRTYAKCYTFFSISPTKSYFVILVFGQESSGEWVWWEKDPADDELWWWVCNNQWHHYKVNGTDKEATGGGWMKKCMALCHMHLHGNQERLTYSLGKLRTHPSMVKAWSKMDGLYNDLGIKAYGRFIP